jgi:glycosyltransferase involved in cell wall biosynthesis
MSPDSPNALISYLPFPLRLPPDSKDMFKHQNRREAIEIVNAFIELGYNVDVVYYNKKAFLPSRKYDVIFGLEPNFEKFARKNPKALKIYYATGSYWKYQNASIIDRVAEVNKRRRSSLRPARLVMSHQSAELADYIIQIGSTFTVYTYPPEIQQKIRLIRQSSFEFLDATLENKDYSSARRKFLWFGGKGAVLKGLDLLLEAFAKRPDLELYIAGAPEKDFINEYYNELYQTGNIHFLEWLDLRSTFAQDIARSCGFVILPSASEGMPGSVISMMRMGLVPIVSRQAAFDGIENFGVLIQNLTVSNVLAIVDEASRFDEDVLYKRAFMSQRFAKENFTLETFKSDLKAVLLQCFNSTQL